MESRERALSRKVEESLKTSGGGNKVTLCNRCHTCMHPGGRQQCPFTNLSDVKATEAMARLMLKLAKLAEEE
eukprot:scaffold263635_cov29-Attheya_sp.AAC.1